VHLIIIKVLRIQFFTIAVLIFGLMGWVGEFIFGHHKEILWSSPGLTIFMTFWVIATYGVIVIVPVTILLDE